jgi:hypothetical protein
MHRDLTEILGLFAPISPESKAMNEAVRNLGVAPKQGCNMYKHMK